eukprot:TRINITY_DN3389_c1_g1_i1.p1 TRINITY_DN3389_c1_g1~~TRINITY_DN3389_c1_g1_i1.p1  ORF type:complete len:877 (-),score=265.03 TRINITY_DN3389_c1_g1_i1:50-2650(-)
MAPAERLADALTPALRSYDVDEETFESLAEMVADAEAEGGEGLTASDFAKTLEDLLEPFLLAFGAEPTAIPGCAMQIAVSLRGMPALATADELPVKAAAKSAAEPIKAASGYPEQAAKEKPKGGVSLADFCTSGSTVIAPKAAAKQSPSAEAAGPPKTLGSLWKSQAGDASAAWDGVGFASTVDPEGDDDAFAEDDANFKWPPADGEKVRGSKQREKAEKKKEKTAKKATPANEASLQDFAALGLQESRGDAEAGKQSVARGVHKEGKGSRNIHLEGVTVSVQSEQGSRDLLREADLHLTAGHVYGLVGKNGSGKTTLLRRLAGKAIPGLPAHFKFGYVAQELAALRDDQSPLEAVVDADEERRLLLEERAELEAALEGAENLTSQADRTAAEAKAQRFSEIEQRLEQIDADGAEDRAKEALLKLQFDEAMLRRPIANLSGGWRMRVALAQAFASRPDVLLLDEPTNHLDLHGVLWLQQHLRRQWGAEAVTKDRIVVIVSHDRAFLDGCATDVLEIYDSKLRNFPGNYSHYLERLEEEQRLGTAAKEEADRQERQALKDIQALKKKAKQHADDKKIRQLKSQQKKLEGGFRLSSNRESAARTDDLISKLREDVTLRFRFPEVPPVEDGDLLNMDSAKVRNGGNVILKDLVLTLDSSSRIAVVGGNGSGKSTLLRALDGELKAEEGPRGRGRKHALFDPAYVTQNHLEKQAQHLQATCMEYLRDCLPDEKSVRGARMTKQSEDTVLRAHLGNFGMGKDALKKVGYLSGGQRARLSMAAAMSQAPTVLLLDEPTNHLDVDSLDALTLGLQAYDGAVVVVSHNRGFLEALCDELWVVANGTVKARPKGEEEFASYFAEYVKATEKSLSK